MILSDSPIIREQYSAHLPALHVLHNLGWHFLTTAQCLTLRGSTREVLLKTRLIEVLQIRRFEYKGESFPLSPGGIDQIVREISAINLGEGLLPANERLYAKLLFGITITEFMPDGKRHQPTIAVVDWMNPDANIWEMTEEPEILSAHGTHSRLPDIVCYVNGIPLVVIEAKRPESKTNSKAIVQEGISQHLRNQRQDEIQNLYAYAQLLISISQVDGRFGTTTTAAKFWSRWREEEFSDEHVTAIKNQQLDANARGALFEGKTVDYSAYEEQIRRMVDKQIIGTEVRESSPVVRMRGGYIEVAVPRRDPMTVRMALDCWYRERARLVFGEHLDALASSIQWIRRNPDMRLQIMKVQWGSCSPAGCLTLNPHLVKAPRECIDYVLLHELCHLKEHNHSQKFYGLLERHLPGWRHTKKRLDELADVILNT
jgi:predicted metal-dependent hydrolase